MARAMQHLNGNLLCAVDIETTGLEPNYHEIWQLCVLPLDSNIDPLKKIGERSILPFYMDLKVNNPDHVDPTSMSVVQLTHAINNGVSFVSVLLI